MAMKICESVMRKWVPFLADRLKLEKVVSSLASLEKTFWLVVDSSNVRHSLNQIKHRVLLN